MIIIMTVKRPKFASAFTLIEVMVAMVVLVIAALGTSGYQYYATRQARIAEAQITATRTAQLLLEDWKSTGGSEDYDPTTLELGFSSALSLPEGSPVGVALGNAAYTITVNDVPMVIVMTWDDIAGAAFRQLTVMVIGSPVKKEEEIKANLGLIISGKLTSESSISSGLISPVTLTTYIRLGASSG